MISHLPFGTKSATGLRLLQLACFVFALCCCDAANDCGFPSAPLWKNWFPSVASTAPVVYPKTDEEVTRFLRVAIARGCKVRPSGAGHSSDGLAVQKIEDDILVLNLADYVPPSSWAQVVNTQTGTIRVSGGASFLELIAAARPKGFLMESQTAGWFFQVAGVMMNPSVHGGTLGQGHIMDSVTGLRVMRANGTISEIFDESTLRVWRGSLGLLGIILGVEVRLRVDTGLDMGVVEFSGRPWTRDIINELWRVILRYDHVQTFYNPYNDNFMASTLLWEGRYTY